MPENSCLPLSQRGLALIILELIKPRVDTFEAIGVHELQNGIYCLCLNSKVKLRSVADPRMAAMALLKNYPLS